ncbi:MAG: type II secretion system F family protein [Proteobacteria bacterium]|nr:type II secretion system F family protein [Pseudomonadota bacterium]
MLNYAYRAIDRDGNGVAGTLTAVDEQSLAEKLQTIGYWLVEAKTCKPDEVREVSRVKRADLAELFANLAVLLDAGLSIVSALRTLESESEEQGLKRVLTDVRLNVETGTSLGEALARHPKIFDEQIRNTIAAGEYGGNLAESLREIARYLEWLGRLMADVKQASTYPIVVLCVLVAFMMLLFGFVVPKFAAILTELGLELPLVTRIVIGIGGFAQNYGLVTLAGIVLAFVGVRTALHRVPTLAFAFDRLKLRMPVFGRLNRMICLSRLTHQLGLLLKSGVPITDALGLCQHSLGNRVYGELVGAALNVVLQGGVLSTAFREQADIPGMLVRMIAVGEETGRMEHALGHVAHHLDEDIPRRIKKLFGIIEPLVMLTLISLVGTVAMAIFLPLMSMIGGLGR